MADLDPAAALVSLADHLHRGVLPPEPVREHVTHAVRAWLNGCPIERALRMRPAGPSYRLRNEALRHAGACLGNDPRALARAVRRFESDIWPRWRRYSAPPPEVSAVHRHLFRAFSAGRMVPTSAKQLNRIMDKNCG